MLSKVQQRQYREELFIHLDGLAIGPTFITLFDHQVINYLIENKTVSLDELTKQFSANDGYLNVGLHILSSQGWLIATNHSEELQYSVTEKGAWFFNKVEQYRPAVNLFNSLSDLQQKKLNIQQYIAHEAAYKQYLEEFETNIDVISTNNEISDNEHQLKLHIEGLLIAPLIVQLGLGGMFHKYFMQTSFRAEEFHEDDSSFNKLLHFLSKIGWFTEKNDTFQFTDKGLFFAKRATAYGVTVSYQPTLSHLNQIIFGDAKALHNPNGDTEMHVYREINVWASGGAHLTYFKKVDEIIIDLFNQPLAQQPIGILDMGCGNGAFLQHIYEVIEQRTLRGKHLDEYPLTLVGVDYNQAALKVTRANLIAADIWAKVIWGDISDPDTLAKTLKEDYHIDLGNLLNVRTFLDHNRIWHQPKQDKTFDIQPIGAFAFEGKRIDHQALANNFIEHFELWKPYIEKYGLLNIELHTLPDTVTAQHIGKTSATAYDATHGYSDQFIIDAATYFKLLETKDLYPVESQLFYFPEKSLATVTISLLRGKESKNLG